MKQKRKINKNFISISLLIIFLCGLFLGAGIFINQIATRSCYRALSDTTRQIALQLKSDSSSNQEQLEVIAGILSSVKDITSPEALDLICSFERRSFIKTLGLLLPDNTIYLCDGTSYSDPSLYDFATLSEKLPFISGSHSGFAGSEERYFFHAVPIEKEQQTVGILLGIVPLSALHDLYQTSVFNNSAHLSIVDNDTGDFLLDTWHNSLGNVNDPEFADRKAKGSYTFAQMKEDMLNKESGYIAFLSKKSGEYLYAFFTPLDINHWTIMLTVPESVAFASARQIRNVLFAIGGINILLFCIYLLVFFLRGRKETQKKEQRLHQSLYMLDIQQTLFNAHTKPELFGTALEKCADMYQAEGAFLMALNGSHIINLFTWSKETLTCEEVDTHSDISASLPGIWQLLSLHKNIIIGNISEWKDNFEKDFNTFENYNITAFALTPVLDSFGVLSGVLGITNFHTVPKTTELLDCVSLNFLMALNNLRSFRQIQTMGTKDMLTGLYNRNKYQTDLDTYSAENQSVCCIYADANGLHELNNHLGHAAGDEMLRCIGVCLQKEFGSEHTYRIGGDEFVAFCRNLPEAEIEQKLSSFQSNIQSHNYHVSVGLAYQDSSHNISHLITEAERKMYENKRHYYEEKGDVTKAREMNKKLEQILLEKRDYDSFLSIISSYFLGVYVVDFRNGLTRAIYKPSYFSDMLLETDYYFLPAIQNYCNTFVHEEDRPAFLAFLDYSQLEKAITAGDLPELHYRKSDGSRLILRIFPATTYSEQQQETFWLFENEK